MKVVKSCAVPDPVKSILFRDIPIGMIFRYAGATTVYIKVITTQTGNADMFCFDENRVYHRTGSERMENYTPFPDAVLVTNEK